MSQMPDNYTVTEFPRSRRLMVDGGRMGLKKHTVHGLLAFDVTLPREIISRYKTQSGQSLSFSAFFLACLGKAMEMNKNMQAYRDWRGRLIIFDEVDVNMLFEVEVGGKKTIRPHIMRGVNKKSVADLHSEIRSFQAQHESSQESKFIDLFVRLPGVFRRLFLWALFKNPRMIKDYYGTVLVSSLSMFGSGSAWAIPVPNHTLQLTLGGISEQPGVANHKVEVRQFLSLTISFDHDLIDGAPAARFIQRLKELVECADGLDDYDSDRMAAKP